MGDGLAHQPANTAERINAEKMSKVVANIIGSGLVFYLKEGKKQDLIPNYFFEII